MAAETTTVDLQAQTVEVLKQIQQLDFNTVLNQWIIPYGTKILLAIAIYFIGKSVARFLSGLLGKAVLRSSKDEMLQGFVSSISYFLFLLIVVIAALSQLGINTSSLVALIGAAGLAIGLALQNSLQNFAAGVMILVFKPFRKGDYIEAGGVAGVVNQIGLLVVELRTGDNKTVLVPNGKVFGDSITNYSTNETRRVDFIFDIDYSSDITAAKQIIADCLAQESRILRNPEPTIVVGSLASNSVQLFVRPWARTADYWGVYFAITEKVKLEFDRAGIAIPFNQLNVHLDQDLVVGIEKKVN
ncbi:mechanosensitive ion channel family protein [Testudinibacter aquarius]|uniref:Small-conductance mechanosensitive channel n=1 Tax=Testudinibacter aquarius TaxID=1524974 RepID=A0A4V6P3W3_9PAST|nr:mechanosensitive ion channel domain-containing protein [Testudinibacter aquarius]KAE9530381.1 mechanosensitive ion channel protein MscS [Testudinibacter aquarius]TCV85979.1 small conductance mechanosensitive channel [Testudinibacter aquarius]TNG93680.1 mechanosensitive ion channel [Testudinibacter aquarius]